MKKIRVGVLCGGQSTEHEISLLSARNVLDALNPDKYVAMPIEIDRAGLWRASPLPQMHGDPPSVRTAPCSPHQLLQTVDLVFPVLHGTMGEDGCVQGLLKLANVPFVGAGVLGSAVGMDKDVLKRLLREAGIPVASFFSLRAVEESAEGLARVKATFGFPCFVKPANQGSSVGIHKIWGEETFEPLLRDAFRYDRKVIVEECIAGREIECSVLGNDHPIASLPGEIVSQHEFYSYEAKYLDPQGALFHIPAQLDASTVCAIQTLAIRSFQVLCAEGMARVDFFLKPSGELIVNEINTIPGFTQISMYPKLWQVSGLPLPQLVDRLIELALERHHREQQLQYVK